MAQGTKDIRASGTMPLCRTAFCGLVTVLLCIVSATASAQFVDDFSRADSSLLGNGWVEKNPNAFFIINNAAAKQATPGFDYRENIAYRPVSENLLDVEVSAEFQLQQLPPGYPQIFSRVQTDTVGFPGTLDAYIFFIDNDSSTAVIGRQIGFSFLTTLANVNVSPALTAGNRYRLRMTTTGTSPVLINGYVEQFNGSDWTIIGQTGYSDNAGQRIDTAGSVGFGGYIEANYSFDNFTRNDLGGGGGQNPLPATTTLNPSSVTEGNAAFTLTVNGSGFVAGSEVRWNGAGRATTFVSATTLQAAITAADIATSGSADVTVFNPAPGGGTSNAQTFTIDPAQVNNPVPVASSMNPSSATAGGGGFTLTVTGSNFVPGAVVRWNGANRNTTFVSASELQTQIATGDIASQGTASVSVFNPAPGGGPSGNLGFTIQPPNNPVPAIASLNPGSTTAGGPGLTLTVNGSNFVPASTLRWNGAGRSTTYVSASQLSATITAADIASPGTAQITVNNPAPGGGISNSLAFIVNSNGGNPAPLLTGLLPDSADAGSSAILVTALGQNFDSGSIVSWNGDARSTTFVSAGELQFILTSDDMLVPAVAAVTVDDAGGRSSSRNFYVLENSGLYFSDDFNRSDGNAVGNGWTEKTPAAFDLLNGEVLAGETNFDFHDTIVYRPGAEDRIDVEASIEFVSGAGEFPQVHARVQRDTLQQANTLDDYILFVDDFSLPPGRLIIARQPGLSGVYECYMAEIPLAVPLTDGDRYRLRFRVTGTNPVELVGVLERYMGNQWAEVVSGTTYHDASTTPAPGLYCDPGFMPAPITSPGTVGFAKWFTPTERLDNFYWLGLSSQVQPPSVSALQPSSIAAGSADFTLTVQGSGFNANTIVQWNGSGRPTSYLSSSVVEATISAADIANPGQFSVTAVTPGSGTSNPVSFVVFSTGGTFVDDFGRADSSVLGNGWIEKNPNTFFIQNNEAVKQSTPGFAYRDNISYRPANEDLLDAEASIEFVLQQLPPGYPQIFTRVQSNSVAVGGTLDAYIFFIDNDASTAVVGRQRGSAFLTSLAFANISPGLTAGERYRLTLRSTGTTAVTLTGTVEWFNGGSWQTIGQANFTDTAGPRIATPGSVGFAGYIEANYRYDNFQRVDLSP